MSDNNIEESVDNKDTDTVAALSETIEEKEQKRQDKKAAKEARKEEKLKKKQDKKKSEDKSDKDSGKSSDNELSATKEDSDMKSASDAEEENVEFDADGNLVVRKKKKKKKKAKKKPEEINIVKELLSLIVYIGIVVLGCYLIITFVGCCSRVDGNSMNDTLNDGDSLWVDKLSYTFGDPERFDVIIFNYDEDTTYVKRIIGLPGETVRIDQNGNIYIDEKLLKENYGNEPIRATHLGRANQPIQLGEDEYFVLGDNRNNSTDSRWADVGNINREDIVGKVILRIYPLSDFGIIK